MTNGEIRMTSETQNSNDRDETRSSFDLEERTAKFGEQIVRFAKSLRVTPVSEPLIKQIVRSGTSIGANYCEANDAETKKVFRQRIATCRKEAKETKHWLQMIVAADESTKADARALWQEAKELNLIFAAIFRKSG